MRGGGDLSFFFLLSGRVLSGGILSGGGFVCEPSWTIAVFIKYMGRICPFIFSL